MSEKRFTTDYSDLLKNTKTFIKMDNERLTYEEIVDLLNEQQATIDCLRQKKIKERKFVLDEKGIVEKISNKSYPRIHSDEKDNPVGTLSCSNLFELVDLLNEQQATILLLKDFIKKEFPKSYKHILERLDE